jgi:hypothetical protein
MVEMKDGIEALRSRVGASFGVPLGPHLVPHQKQAVAAAEPPLPSPEVTGSLQAAELATLYSIANYAGTIWALGSQSAFGADEFTGFVNLKTQQTPSYYTVYQQTLSLYAALVAQLGVDGALVYLYTPNPASPPQDWDAVRYWSVQQYLILYVTSGNFRSYGWLNFPGWMGGPYNDPSHLPYRGINDGQ